MAGLGSSSIVPFQSNGEKFSPGPIESVFRSNPNVADALVVGVNQAQIGCLIFPRSISAIDKIKCDLDELTADANKQSPSHAQLGNEMCLVIDSEKRINALPKSSKGTIQRGLAYEEFTPEIYRLYSSIAPGDAASGSKQQLAGAELRQWLKDRVEDIVGRSDNREEGNEELQEDSDLFSWGVDSVKAARLRFAIAQVGSTLSCNAHGPLLTSRLERILILGATIYHLMWFSNTEPFRGMVAFYQMTPRQDILNLLLFRLADLCTALRTGQQHQKQTAQDEIELMRALVEKYSDFTHNRMNGNGHIPANGGNEGKTVVSLLHVELQT